MADPNDVIAQAAARAAAQPPAGQQIQGPPCVAGGIQFATHPQIRPEIMAQTQFYYLGLLICTRCGMPMNNIMFGPLSVMDPISGKPALKADGTPLWLFEQARQERQEGENAISTTGSEATEGGQSP